jgi:hypothetical protein
LADVFYHPIVPSLDNFTSDEYLTDDSSGNAEEDDVEELRDNDGEEEEEEEEENESDWDDIPLSSFKVSNDWRKGFLK